MSYQATFSVGLEGCRERADADTVEDLVLDCLRDVVREGFPADAVRASVNSVEFMLREFNTGSMPRGLSFMLAAMSSWVYDQEPLLNVRFADNLSQLKEELASGERVFERMVETYLLDNTHRVGIVMEPNLELEAVQEEEERAALAKTKASMSREAIQDVINSTQELKAMQSAEDSEEAKASIPRLQLADLTREVREHPIKVHSDQAGAVVLAHDIACNGILHVKVALDLASLPLEDYPLLPLFSKALTETGTAKYDRTQLTRHIGMFTGGLSAQHWFSPKSAGNRVGDPDSLLSQLIVAGKVTHEHSHELFSLMTEVLTAARLDERERITQMLKEMVVRYQTNFVSSGHAFASARMDARYTRLGYARETTGGLAHYDTMKKLLDEAETDEGWAVLQRRLERMRETILQAKRVVDLTSDAELLQHSRTSLIPGFLASLPPVGDTHASESEHGAARLAVADPEFFAVATKVNYVGQSVQVLDAGEPVHGSAVVADNFLGTGYLWDHVRVMGGAYGAMASFGHHSGVFNFVSYRDPNLLETMRIYEGAGKALMDAAGNMSQAELELAVIGAIGEMDTPSSPDQQGFESFRRWMVGETAAERQQLRDEVLSTTPQELIDFGRRLDAAFRANPKHNVVIGSKSALEAANQHLGNGTLADAAAFTVRTL